MIKQIAFVLIYFFTISCQPGQNSNIPDKSNKQDPDKERISASDLKDVELIISRGAFHYDRFILKDNLLSYVPEKDCRLKDYPQFMEKSSVKLEDSVVVNLVNELLSKNFYEMDTIYTARSTCTSMLKIQLTIKGKSKTITCDDYIRECPDLLRELEDKIIKLHGKNLTRIILPG